MSQITIPRQLFRMQEGQTKHNANPVLTSIQTSANLATVRTSAVVEVSPVNKRVRLELTQGIENVIKI